MFEKGGGLIAVTGIMQTIAVIVNIIASWTIIIVMHIIITLKNGALVVDSCRMMMSRTMMNSPTSNDVDNDSNCLRDTSDCNESISMGTSTIFEIGE